MGKQRQQQKGEPEIEPGAVAAQEETEKPILAVQYPDENVTVVGRDAEKYQFKNYNPDTHYLVDRVKFDALVAALVGGHVSWIGGPAARKVGELFGVNGFEEAATLSRKMIADHNKRNTK